METQTLAPASGVRSDPERCILGAPPDIWAFGSLYSIARLGWTGLKTRTHVGTSVQGSGAWAQPAGVTWKSFGSPFLMGR